ncbi:MAG: hypothetical protein KJO72_01540 [Gammaproteobacteria bacterium]|nr:hypothetical protein [Gammaproteobacteria bacterium]NNJ79090.1 hypothetical protein [Xanthomonadales bacterium]
MRMIGIKGYAYAVHVVVWFVVLSTVAAELSPAFKALLADGLGHHWIAKSDIAVVLFILTALIFGRKTDPEDVTGLVRGVLLSVIAGSIAIFGFYSLHYIGLA